MAALAPASPHRMKNPFRCSTEVVLPLRSVGSESGSQAEAEDPRGLVTGGIAEIGIYRRGAEHEVLPGRGVFQPGDGLVGIQLAVGNGQNVRIGVRFVARRGRL